MEMSVDRRGGWATSTVEGGGHFLKKMGTYEKKSQSENIPIFFLCIYTPTLWLHYPECF